MSFIGKAIGKITGADAAAKGSERAAQTQAQSAQLGIEEARAARLSMEQLLAPYVQAGLGGLTGQKDLLGLNGAQAQQGAIGGIEASPQFTSMMAQGENALLQNAAATGGLRGGNTQDALMQMRPQMLSQLIQQQYQNLGGLTALGQNAAAGTGNAGMQTGANIGNLLQQQGAAIAGGQIARAGVARQGFSDGLKIASTAAGFF